MKSQNDLIVSIVAVVLAIGIAITMFVTKRDPYVPAPAPEVNDTALALPEGDVTMAASLPGGGGGGGSKGGGSPFGMAGGGAGGANRPHAALGGGGGK